MTPQRPKTLSETAAVLVSQIAAEPALNGCSIGSLASFGEVIEATTSEPSATSSASDCRTTSTGDTPRPTPGNNAATTHRFLLQQQRLLARQLALHRLATFAQHGLALRQFGQGRINPPPQLGAIGLRISPASLRYIGRMARGTVRRRPSRRRRDAARDAAKTVCSMIANVSGTGSRRLAAVEIAIEPRHAFGVVLGQSAVIGQLLPQLAPALDQPAAAQSALTQAGEGRCRLIMETGAGVGDLLLVSLLNVGARTLRTWRVAVAV